MESSLNIILGEIFKMAREQKKQTNGIWWKTIIVLTFIISLICLGILVQNKFPKYEYYTKIIAIKNNIIIENPDGKIVDYLCDEGVHVYEFFGDNRVAFSTWDGDSDVKPKYKGMTGSCMIKVRRRI